MVSMYSILFLAFLSVVFATELLDFNAEIIEETRSVDSNLSITHMCVLNALKSKPEAYQSLYDDAKMNYIFTGELKPSIESAFEDLRLSNPEMFEALINNEVLPNHPYNEYMPTTKFTLDQHPDGFALYLRKLEQEIFLPELERISNSIETRSARYLGLLMLMSNFYKVAKQVDRDNRVHCTYLFRAAASDSELVLAALRNLDNADPVEMAIKVNQAMNLKDRIEARRVLKQTFPGNFHHYDLYYPGYRFDRTEYTRSDFQKFEFHLENISYDADSFRVVLSPLQITVTFDVLLNPNTPENRDFLLIATKNSYKFPHLRPFEYFNLANQQKFKLFWSSMIYSTIHEMQQSYPEHLLAIFGTNITLDELEDDVIGRLNSGILKSNVGIIIEAGHVPSYKLWLSYGLDNESHKALFEIIVSSDYHLTDEIMQIYLEYVIPLTLTQPQKEKVFINAVRNGFNSVIVYLLDEGDLLLTESFKLSILYTAIENTCDDTVELIFKSLAINYQTINKKNFYAIAAKCFDRLYGIPSNLPPLSLSYFPQIITDRVLELDAAIGPLDRLKVLVQVAYIDRYRPQFNTERARRLMVTWQLDQESIDDIFIEALKYRCQRVMEFMITEPHLIVSESVRKSALLRDKLSYNHYPMFEFLSKYPEVFKFDDADIEKALTLGLFKRTDSLKVLLKNFNISREALERVFLIACKAGKFNTVNRILKIVSFTNETLLRAIELTKKESLKVLLWAVLK